MVSGNPGRSGLLHSLGRVWSRGVEGLLDRGELIAVELKQEKERFLVLLLGGLLVALLAFMAFLILNVTIVAVAWEHRVGVLAGLFSFYLLLALVVGLGLWRRVRTEPAPFAATVEEFRKDRTAFFGDR